MRGATDSIAPPPAMRATCDAIAAGDDGAAALEHALERVRRRRAHRVVAALGRDDESGLAGPPGVRAAGARLRQAKSRSVLAAQMRSFSVTPPASCVENATAQRLVGDGELGMVVLAVRDPRRRAFTNAIVSW